MREANLDLGLNDEGILPVFNHWWAWGKDSGMSPMDIAAMPSWMADDFGVMMRELGYGKDERKAKKKAKSPASPPKRKGIRRK